MTTNQIHISYSEYREGGEPIDLSTSFAEKAKAQHSAAYNIILKVLSSPGLHNMKRLIPGFCVEWLGNPDSELFSEGVFEHSSSIFWRVNTDQDVKLDIPYTVEQRHDYSHLSFGFYKKNTILDTTVPATKRLNSQYPNSIELRKMFNFYTVLFDWYTDREGQWHRTDGPCHITVKIGFDGDASVAKCSYKVVGHKMSTKKDFVQWYEMTHLEEYRGM